MLTLLVHKYSNGAKRLASRSANLVRRAPFTTDLTLWHFITIKCTRAFSLKAKTIAQPCAYQA